MSSVQEHLNSSSIVTTEKMVSKLALDLVTKSKLLEDNSVRHRDLVEEMSWIIDLLKNASIVLTGRTCEQR